MNVYVLQSAIQLAKRGVEVEIFTRATSSADAPVVDAAPGVRGSEHCCWSLRRAGQGGSADSTVCLRRRSSTGGSATRARVLQPDPLALLVVRAGRLARPRPLGRAPRTHRPHLAAVKNLSLAEGDTPEPAARQIGEQQVVAESDRLVANTTDEAKALHELYGADPHAYRRRGSRRRSHPLPPGRSRFRPRVVGVGPGRGRRDFRRPDPTS